MQTLPEIMDYLRLSIELGRVGYVKAIIEEQQLTIGLQDLLRCRCYSCRLWEKSDYEYKHLKTELEVIYRYFIAVCDVWFNRVS